MKEEEGKIFKKWISHELNERQIESGNIEKPIKKCLLPSTKKSYFSVEM